MDIICESCNLPYPEEIKKCWDKDIYVCPFCFENWISEAYNG